MNTLANVDPKDLRPLVHERIDQLTDNELESIRQALLDLEIRHLRESVGRAVDEAYATGKCEPTGVEASIREHRAAHPYR